MINRHAGPALMMCSTLMGAAVLMGVLVYGFNASGAAAIAKPGVEMMKTSVVSNMASIISMILPAALGQHLPLVIGILSVPLALCFDTDSYFYGMLPVMIAIGASFGVEAFPIAVAMVVCRNCATFISPYRTCRCGHQGSHQIQLRLCMDLLDPLHAVCSTDRNPSVINDNFLEFG